MRRPIRSSLIGAIAFSPLALAPGGTGPVIEIGRLLAVFFALHSFLLLALSLCWNFRWRLTPPPRWGGAVQTAAGSGPENPGAW